MTKGVFKKKSPGKRLLIHKSKKRPSKTYCSICGGVLHSKVEKSTKSSKFSERPYRGNICHACLKTSIQLSKTQEL